MLGWVRRYTGVVFEWIKRLRKEREPQRKLGARDEGADALHVELAEFAPGIMPFLGLTTYLQLELYEASSRAIAGAPDLQAKEVLARSAGITLAKHQKLSDEMRARGREPHLVMMPYTPMIDEFIARIDTPDWHQHVLSIYLVGGLFDDFFSELAQGISDKFAPEAIELLSDNRSRDELKDLLATEIEANPVIAGKLALWGRRLVGDTLLVSRDVLQLSEGRTFVASLVEPIFTELIADHTRRMDTLGLTA